MIGFCCTDDAKELSIMGLCWLASGAQELTVEFDAKHLRLFVLLCVLRSGFAAGRREYVTRCQTIL